jgi:O-methyltransferase involved in polyketide biosynthesis
VLNLVAGVDARPNRMALPNSLTWIEVDLPEIIEYTSAVLATSRAA